MKKDVQEALENAIAGFEKRHQAEQERLRERERFETDRAQIRTTVVLPALEEVAVVLRKAGWQCEVRAGDKDPGVHVTVYRGGRRRKAFHDLPTRKAKKHRTDQCGNESFCRTCGKFCLRQNY